MKDSDRGWLAGFIDAEACFGAYWRERSVVTPVTISNTDRRAIDKCQTIWPFGVISSQETPHKRIYRWKPRQSEVAPLIRELFPWLVSKSDQAWAVHELRRSMLTSSAPAPTPTPIKNQREALVSLISQAKHGDIVLPAWVRPVPYPELPFSNEQEIWYAWLAGMIDGDGAIFAYTQQSVSGCREPKTYGKIQISGTDIKIMNRCRSLFRKCSVSTKPARCFGKVPSFTWQAAGAQNLLDLLDMIGPHLVIKREQAEHLRSLCLIVLDNPQCGREGHPPENALERTRLAGLISAANRR
jgi:hypothetical protein